MVYRPVYTLYPNELIKLIPFVLTAIGIAQLGFFQKGKLYIGYVRNRGFFVAYTFFLLLLLASYTRSYNSSFSELGTYTLPLQFLLLIVYTYLFFHHLSATESSVNNLARRSIMLLLVPSAAFVFIDITLYLNGIHVGVKASAESEAPSVMARMLGLDLRRAHFSLGGNHNNFALFMGGILLLALSFLVLYAQDQKHKLFNYFAIAVVGFALLVADVRGVFLGLVLSLGAWYAIKQFRWRTLPYTFIFIPLALLLAFPFFQEIMKLLGSSFITDLSRGGDASDVFTFNNRTYIWAGCLNFLADFEPAHLVGYGQAGHLTSGAYIEWAWFFPKTVTHNLYLQYILDVGYVGFISLLAVLCISIREGILLLRKGIAVGVLPLIYTVYFVISGTFEPSIGIYNHPNTMFFLLNLLFVGLIRNYYLKHEENARKIPEKRLTTA